MCHSLNTFVVRCDSCGIAAHPDGFSRLGTALEEALSIGWTHTLNATNNFAIILCTECTGKKINGIIKS